MQYPLNSKKRSVDIICFDMFEYYVFVFTQKSVSHIIQSEMSLFDNILMGCIDRNDFDVNNNF